MQQSATPPRFRIQQLDLLPAKRGKRRQWVTIATAHRYRVAAIIASATAGAGLCTVRIRPIAA
jgi:hypothetical protein